MPEVWHQTCRLLSPFSSINCSFHCVWFCSKSPGGKSETLPFAVHSWECQVGDLSIAFTALYHTWKRAWDWGLSAETHMKNWQLHHQQSVGGRIVEETVWFCFQILNMLFLLIDFHFCNILQNQKHICMWKMCIYLTLVFGSFFLFFIYHKKK